MGLYIWHKSPSKEGSDRKIIDMKKILVPCDFSATAREAYAFALNLAGLVDAEIVVLNVIDFPFMYEASYAEPTYYNPDFLLDLEKAAQRKFAEMKRSHKRQQKVTFSVLKGAVTAVIRNAIADMNIDLVVMGTNGSTKGMEEYFIGSNTEKIVRFSPVPVFAIRKSVLPSSIQDIVVPTDLGQNETDLMNRIKELQNLFYARLHLLAVNTPLNLRKTSDRMAELNDFARKYDLANYTVNIRDDLYVNEAILAFVKEIKADIIAMGTHGRRGLSHLFMGSVAEDVVNHASCPIWTYKLRK